MKVQVILGSPRRGGNTEILVNYLLSGINEKEVISQIVRLDERHVSPIRDCSKCMTLGKCMQEDDFEEIMNDFLAADYVILATPLYWYGPSAQLKSFIDRWSCKLYWSSHLTGSEEDFRSKIRGKKIIAVCAHEEPGHYVIEHLMGMIEWSCNYLGMDLIAKVDGVGNYRGEVKNDEKALAKAFLIGATLGRSI
ncbi:MAG: flavodoxin family protein [Bacillota bacterium]